MAWLKTGGRAVPFARATRGLLGNAASRRREGGRVRTGNMPSLDARSLAQPSCLPKEDQRGERGKKTTRQRHPSSHDGPAYGGKVGTDEGGRLEPAKPAGSVRRGRRLLHTSDHIQAL
jgi:hypothetical protein